MYDEIWTYLASQKVKNLPAMQETWILSLGQEDHLEKGMATHSSVLAWRTPWIEEPGGLQSIGLQTDTSKPLTQHNNMMKYIHDYYISCRLFSLT